MFSVIILIRVMNSLQTNAFIYTIKSIPCLTMVIRDRIFAYLNDHCKSTLFILAYLHILTFSYAMSMIHLSSLKKNKSKVFYIESKLYDYII